MKKFFCSLLTCLVVLPLCAETVSFKIPVLTVREKDGAPPVGNCSRIDFEYAKSDSREPLAVGYREDTPAGTGEVIRSSLWLAGITAALQRNSSLCGARITVNFRGYVDGPSAGAIICLATLTALDGRTFPADFAMTGTIMPDGTIGSVGGIQYKLRAAGKAKIKRVCIPADIRFEVDPVTRADVDLEAVAREAGMALYYARNIEEAYCIMHRLPMPEQRYPDQNLTKLLPEIETAVASLYDEGERIYNEGRMKLTGGDEKKMADLENSFEWDFLTIDACRKYRRADHFLYAIEKMKLPIAAWGILGNSFEQLELIEKRHPDYEKSKAGKVAYLTDLAQCVKNTFISKYFIKRFQEKFCDFEQNRLHDQLTRDYYGDDIHPEIPQNDIPAQLEDVNRYSSSIPFKNFFLQPVPATDKLMQLEDKDLDMLIAKERKKLMLSLILPRLDSVNRVYLKKLSAALPQMSANADVDGIEHLFYATGMAACNMYEVDDLPAVKDFIKKKLAEEMKDKDKKISDEEAINYLAGRNRLFLSWLFAKDDSVLMHIRKEHTEYKSYHDVAAIKSHILLFTMAYALRAQVNIGNNLSRIIDRARYQAIRNIIECKKQNIPCIQAVAYFETAEVNRDTPKPDKMNILVNYWNASLMAKALVMSFSKQSQGSGIVSGPRPGAEEMTARFKKALQEYRSENYAAAAELLQQCDKNDPDVRYLLGVLYFYEKLPGDQDNIRCAIEHLEFAALSSDDMIDARYLLGRCYLRTEQLDRAIEAFKFGADRGHAESQYLLGRIYWYVEEIRNLQMARMWFKKAADQGHTEAAREFEMLSAKDE